MLAVRRYTIWSGAAVLALAAGCSGRANRPDPGNELPFGVVDAPHGGQTVGRTVEVAGWALDDVRVDVVNIYVDGRFRGPARLTIRRPDVSKAFSKYIKPGATDADVHGWNASVDLGDVPGPHTIIAQAVDDRGATRDIGSATVTLIGRE